jgi:hypothetical protein
MILRVILRDLDRNIHDILECEVGYIKSGKFDGITQYVMNRALDSKADNNIVEIEVDND